MDGARERRLDENSFLKELAGLKMQFDSLKVPHPAAGFLSIMSGPAIGLFLGVYVFQSMFWRRPPKSVLRQPDSPLFLLLNWISETVASDISYGRN